MRPNKMWPNKMWSFALAGIAVTAAFILAGHPALAQTTPAASPASAPAILPPPAATKAAAAPAADQPRTKVRKRTVASSEQKPQMIELPAGDDVLPDRQNAEAVDRNCLACHSAEAIMNQPSLPREVWAYEIEKMRTAYKAPIDPGDVDTILDYLTSIRGESRRSWR